MERVRTGLRWFFGVIFIVAGVNHFVDPDFYVSIMPPYFPWHEQLVFASGVAELVVGITVCLARCRPYSGWLAIAVLAAVFPANLHMALNAESYPDVPEYALWVRLPVQLLLIAWAWWATRLPSEKIKED